MSELSARAREFLARADVRATAVVEAGACGAKGVARRLVGGEVRHLEVRRLWARENARSKVIAARRAAGDAHAADHQTKFLALNGFLMLMNLLPLRVPQHEGQLGWAQRALVTFAAAFIRPALVRAEKDICRVQEAAVPGMIVIFVDVFGWVFFAVVGWSVAVIRAIATCLRPREQVREEPTPNPERKHIFHHCDDIAVQSNSRLQFSLRVKQT